VKFYRNERIEQLAERRLAELERVLEAPLQPPIPIDLVAEQVLGLNFLWDDIPELPGETVFAGLIPEKHQIVMNERHKELFERKPGLERFTKGHEMGHWDLFVDQSHLGQPTLPGLNPEHRFAYKTSSSGRVQVLSALLRDPDKYAFLLDLQRRRDQPNEARAVNRYAAALIMPRTLIRQAAVQVDCTHWPNLYRLAETFGVTISALRVRLDQLNLVHLGDQKRLYASKEAGVGQQSLW
jgi:hypothetical protein